MRNIIIVNRGRLTYQLVPSQSRKRENRNDFFRTLSLRGAERRGNLLL